ncbi:MAG: hypothetical protein NC350_06525 [Corallococcus sp.]|nr:hypothetical protein [Corallococcus sp.]
MNSLKKLYLKIKSVKNIEIILAVILCIVVICLFVGTGLQKSTSSDNTTYSFYEYMSSLENKLINVISAVDGVNCVSVAISYVSGVEKVYAFETKKQVSGGVTTETETIVTVGGEPLIVKEVAPLIQGVVVVADGAKNPIIKMRINEIVVTLLNINSSQVQVFS